MPDSMMFSPEQQAWVEKLAKLLTPERLEEMRLEGERVSGALARAASSPLEDRDDAGDECFSRPWALGHVLVSPVNLASFLLVLDGKARVEEDGDVHPLHGGLDHVDHVPARHHARDVQLEDEDVGFLRGDGREGAVAVGYGLDGHLSLTEGGHRGLTGFWIIVDQEHALLTPPRAGWCRGD